MKNHPCLLLLSCCSFVAFGLADKPCDVFCDGPLLAAVQMANLFPDSKHFVDMSMVHSAASTLAAFEKLNNSSDAEELRQFVEDNFREPGSELQSCNPADFQRFPASFERIRDPQYRQWAYELHAKWLTLCRKVKPEVLQHPHRYSLIPVPHPFVIPGGRFREFYYWDSFWIIKGLIASEMFSTARGMIRNFAYIVKRFGFVPNGGRLYYLNRSQPPVLAACVEAYVDATGDLDFIHEMLPVLEREQRFWDERRSVDWRGTHLYRYGANTRYPRSESYREDVHTAAHWSDVESRANLWSEIVSATESGWDFSSRWFATDGPAAGTLASIRTSELVPVDLNAFLCGNLRILAKFQAAVGNATMAAHHNHDFERMRYAMHRHFWDPSRGSWFDLDTSTGERSSRFYLSTTAPLFTGCAPPSSAAAALSYLDKSGATAFAGGLPTSFERTGEQWDAPNGWAPLNHMAIEGLRQNSQRSKESDAAFRMADRWIQTNFFVYRRTGKMFEKYDVSLEEGAAGSGGEYDVQEGFGWTNGVVLDLLLTYGDRLRAPAVHSFFDNLKRLAKSLH